MKVLTIIFGIVVSIFGSQKAIGQESWKIIKKAGECILNNSDSYLQSTSDPVIIMVSLCPNNDQQKALEILMENSGLPDTSSALPENNGADNVIVFTKKDIKCLKSIKAKYAGDYIFLSKKPCK